MAGKFHRLARINTERKETQMHDITITSATFEGATIPAVSARDLHAFLGVKRDFTSWIKGRIKQYGFVEGVDYLLTKTGEQLPSGTKYLSEYTITVSMGKELSMVERTPKGREVRLYFIACERAAMAQHTPSITREVHDRVMAYERKDRITFALASLGSRHMIERKEALRDLREEKALLEDITQLRLMLGQ